MKKNLFFAIGMIALISSCGDSNKSTVSDAEVDAAVEKMLKDSREQLAAKQLEKDLVNGRFSWKYTSSEDEMTSKKTKVARITSPDVVNLDFPYQGGTYATLYLRDQGGSLDAFISVTDGQLTTNYNNPKMTVRFGDKKPIDYRVSDSADGDSKLLFFNSAKSFIDNVKSADSVKIQCMFYDNGNHVYTFNTKGLEW